VAAQCTVADKEAASAVMEERVEALAGSLEARMQKLSDELASRDDDVAALEAEKAKQGAALEDMAALLRQSVAERERLAEELEEQHGGLKQVRVREWSVGSQRDSGETASGVHRYWREVVYIRRYR
jgi:peptidoglycan hydrolase CwlO-like protein